MVKAISTDDEAELLQYPDGFWRLYEHYFPTVYNYIRYRVDMVTLAEDLTSETFIRALERQHTFDSCRGSFAAWLFTIARNLVNSHYRARRRRMILPLNAVDDLPDPTPGPETRILGDEQHAELLTALQQLSERERDLLGLKFASNLSHREIAHLTGLTENHVSVVLYRALRRLRCILEASNDQPSSS
jgi:RNA polymerase sigma-70 factor (ECF subfamily)